MTTRITVTPRAGRTVPKPDGTTLAPGGETLPDARWWRRRAADGDVTIAAAKAPSKTRSKAPSKQPEKD